MDLDLVGVTANVNINSLHQKTKVTKSSLTKNTKSPTIPMSAKPLFTEEQINMYPIKKSGVVTVKTLKNYSTRCSKSTTCFSDVENGNSDRKDSAMSFLTTTELVQDYSVNLAESSTSDVDDDVVYNKRPSTANSEIAKSAVTTVTGSVISQKTAQRSSRRPMENLTKQLKRLVVEHMSTIVTTDIAVPTVLKDSTNKRKSVTVKTAVVTSSSQQSNILQHSTPRYKSTRYLQTIRNRQKTSIPKVNIAGNRKRKDDSKRSRGNNNAVPSTKVAIPKSIKKSL